jgi:hypothetical protein
LVVELKKNKKMNNKIVNNKEHKNDFQGANQYTFEPSESLLYNWKLWIAQEVVVQLRDNQAEELDWAQVIMQLDLSEKKVFSALFKEIEQEFEQIKAQISLVIEPEKAQASLEEFFLKITQKQLHQKSQKLKYQMTEYLQSSLSSDFQQASPRKLIKFLEDLAKSLFYQKNDFEKQKVYYRKQENAAFQAFVKLKENQDPKGIANSLLLIFKSKLNIDVCEIYSCTLLNLIQQCQTYCESSRRSEVMLNKIEASLKAKTSIDLISLPVFSILNQVDIDRQRALLELSTSHSLNVLGTSIITWQQVEAKLLQNVESVARKVCSDFQSQFMDHLVIIRNRDKI